MPLVVVAGPIGNLGDLSPRAADALKAADFWIVEDTRVSARLQAHLGVKRPMKVLNEHTPPGKVAALASESAESNSALLTDAGTPGISDPGASLVDLCLESDVEVDAIPGPSAVTDAIALSGFFAQRFAFLGFLPRKAGAMREVLAPFSDSSLTLVLFESPHRMAQLLSACSQELGERRYAICRELTKSHQQVWRARLPQIPDKTQVPHKGEVTIVVEGKRRNHAQIGDREYNAG